MSFQKGKLWSIYLWGNRKDGSKVMYIHVHVYQDKQWSTT